MQIITPTAKKAIETALAEVLKQHGLKIGTMEAKDIYSLNLQICATDNNGATVTQEKLDFENLAERYGLKPEHYDKTFTFRAQLYRIKELNPRAPAMPIIAERVHDGKRFRMRPHTVLGCLTIGSAHRRAAA